jgi:uncharacterized membrane protein
VLAFTSPNPTAVGGEALLAEKEAAKGIQRITRHRFLWGIAFWSSTHLILNGDFASLVFFGSLLLVAIGGTFSIDEKRRKALGEAWDRFAGITSNLPFLAVIQGRNSFQISEIGWWPAVLAVMLYGLILHFHRTLFGGSPLPL